jgi:endogenous inhibitor of DNA gyrase (YacG/DUF329 family)
MIQARCPICDRPMPGAERTQGDASGRSPDTAKWPEFPFCSPRCRLIDLGRWLSEAYPYRVPVEDVDTESPEGSAPEMDIP